MTLICRDNNTHRKCLSNFRVNLHDSSDGENEYDNVKG